MALLCALLAALVSLPVSLVTAGPAGGATAGAGASVFVGSAAVTRYDGVEPTGSQTVLPALSSVSSLEDPYDAACDAHGDLWVVNRAGSAGSLGSIVEFLAGPGRGRRVAEPDRHISDRATELDRPTGLAFDPATNLWVINNAVARRQALRRHEQPQG
jgi:hypothetical protein